MTGNNINPIYTAAAIPPRLAAAVAKNAYNEFGPELEGSYKERLATSVGGPIGLIMTRSLRGTGFNSNYFKNNKKINKKNRSNIQSGFYDNSRLR